MKLRTLLPTLKEKKRYVAFEIISEQTFTFSDAAKAITGSVINTCGTINTAAMGMNIINYEKNKGVIRVAHTSVDALKSALCLCTTINETPAIIKSIGVSGILNKAQIYAQGGE